MPKKIAISIIFVFVAGLGFSQTNFERMPRHTITVDVGPTIIGMWLGALSGLLFLDDDGHRSSSGSGFALQYDHQVLQRLSVAGRFAYMGVNASNDANDVRVSSFSMEAHGRVFPAARTFFLGGMVGYGNLAVRGFNGDSVIADRASMNYFKYGGRLGWRINFGRRGGFTFEPSLGWFNAVGFGNTLGARLYRDPEDVREFDNSVSILENFIFIGGPRVTLAFGWMF